MAECYVLDRRNSPNLSTSLCDNDFILRFLQHTVRPSMFLATSVEGNIESDLVARSLTCDLSKSLMLYPQASRLHGLTGNNRRWQWRRENMMIHVRYDGENQVLNEAQATIKTCALQLANAVCLLMHEQVAHVKVSIGS